MSRLIEASRLPELNSLAELVQGFVPRLFVPHLPALIAIGGITFGSMLVTPNESHAANGRGVQVTTIPTGSGCTNCGQNRNMVTRSPVASQTVSVGTPVQHAKSSTQGKSSTRAESFTQAESFTKRASLQWRRSRIRLQARIAVEERFRMS